MCITSPYCHSAAYQQLNLTGLTGDPPFKPKTCCLRRAVCVCVCVCVAHEEAERWVR